MSRTISLPESKRNDLSRSLLHESRRIAVRIGISGNAAEVEGRELFYKSATLRADLRLFCWPQYCQLGSIVSRPSSAKVRRDGMQLLYRLSTARGALESSDAAWLDQSRDDALLDYRGYPDFANASDLTGSSICDTSL